MEINDKVLSIIETGNADGSMVDFYNCRKSSYDESVAAKQYIGPTVAAQAVLKYCPVAAKGDVKIFDAGAGSGLVGSELKKLGFKIIDGVDPSKALIEQAELKGAYRNLFCAYFTKDPMDIPAESYDVIVSAGAMMSGHIPYDSLHEMIRLVKPGGIICIVTRIDTIEKIINPKYANNLLSLIQNLEDSGKWQKVAWEKVEHFHAFQDGVLMVFKTCI